METFASRHLFPEFGGQTLDVMYFKDVTNAADIMELIRGGGVTAAFINPEFVCTTNFPVFTSSGC